MEPRGRLHYHIPLCHGADDIIVGAAFEANVIPLLLCTLSIRCREGLDFAIFAVNGVTELRTVQQPRYVLGHSLRRPLEIVLLRVL